ncbi:MAG TPA: hypothetical protein VFG05_01910 [Methylocella sp.]|nr:hypothetical protein [Methylocella sp.]
MTVIEHDFGKKKRQAARRFRKLLDLDALHEANVQANPLPYLERASERIYQLEKALFEAAQAAAGPSSQETFACGKVEVDEAEYQALLNFRAMLEKALASLKNDADT